MDFRIPVLFFIYQERLYMPWDNTPRLHGFLTVHVACRKFVHIRNTPTISDYMNTTFRRTLQQIHTWNPAFHPRKSYFLCSKQVCLSGEGTCLPAALPGFEQCAKKVESDSPGLVDFTIGLVNSVFNLPDGQVMFFWGIWLTEELWTQFC